MNALSLVSLRRLFRRSRLPVVAWAAVFLLAAAGDAFAQRACPHHRGAAEGHAVEVARHGGADHAHHHAPAGTGGHDAEHEGCTCLGACQPAGGAAFRAADAAVLRTAPESFLRIVPPSAVAEGARAPIPYVLPYALAPPVESRSTT